MNEFSVNHKPLEGVTVKKLAPGKEAGAQAPAEGHVFFKDGRGDTYEATGRDLKGMTPGATVQFGKQEVIVASIAPSTLTITDVPSAIRVAREAHSLGYKEQSGAALARAIEVAADPDSALAIATVATELGRYEAVGPALEKGAKLAGGEGVFGKFANSARALGYHVMIASNEQDLMDQLSTRFQ